MAKTMTYAPAEERGIRFARWGWFVVVMVAVVVLLTVLPLSRLWVKTWYIDLNSGDERTVRSSLGVTVQERVTSTGLSRAVRQYASGPSPRNWVAVDVRGPLMPIEVLQNGRACGACQGADLALGLVNPPEPARRQYVTNVARLLATKQYDAMNRRSVMLMTSAEPTTRPAN